MTDPWNSDLSEKLETLKQLSAWAKACGFVPARMHIQQAISSLEDHIAFRAYFKGNGDGMERTNTDAHSQPG